MKKKVYILAGIIGLSILACLLIFQFKIGKFHDQAPLFEKLGTYQRQITTQIPMAQRYFDQGLVLFYGFDWSESARSFKEAARLDPQCAICHWGIALALANKINAPLNGNEFKEGEIAIQQALGLSPGATSAEQGLIQALALHYLHAPLSHNNESIFSCHEASGKSQSVSLADKMAYIHAMGRLSDQFPADPDVQALYASALFFLVAGKAPQQEDPAILEAKRVLTQSLALNPTHPGTNHFFIHITEPFSHPADALPNADLLKTLVPGSPHLVHMPSHIYYLTGRYHEASQSNLQAIEAYKKYNKTARRQGFEPEINYLYFHNYDFLRTAAMMEGNKAQALKAAKQMLEAPYPAWLANEPELQWFMPIPLFVKTHFALWDEILKEPKPEDKYGYAQGMWHYAHGMALTHTGHAQEALTDSNELQAIIKRGNINGNLGEGGVKLLTIANAVLYANIADKFGDEKLTIAHLTYAMKIQNSMPYHEPPDWYFPLMQSLGDAYLKWGKPDHAKVMYELTLAQYPNNGWSLYGLEKSMRALGQPEKAEFVHAQWKEAWRYSDIEKPLTLFNHE
jgi:tetratricopeptide (TPR) repeat protein